MKPSQVPNQLPHPPPRRMLPLQSPELWRKDRLGPSAYPHQHHLRPYSPVNIGTVANRPNLMPRDRLGAPNHSAQPPGSLRFRVAPISPVNHGTTAYRPQPSSPGIYHPANHQFIKDLSDPSPSSHIRRDQVNESKVPLSYTGCTNITGQRQESNKVLIFPLLIIIKKFKKYLVDGLFYNSHAILNLCLLILTLPGPFQ